MCREQQRDLGAAHPAPATQTTGTGDSVLSHLLPWLHGQRGFKEIWRVSVQAPENSSALWEQGLTCCTQGVLLLAFQCHFVPHSLGPEHTRLLFQIPLDPSCSAFLKCYSCVCITSDLSEPVAGVVHILHHFIRVDGALK